MHMYRWTTGFTAAMMLAGTVQSAEPAQEFEQIQVTQCLAAKLPASYQTLSSNEHFRILNVPSTELDRIAKLADEGHCGRFVNVSHQLENKSKTMEQAAQRLIARSPAKLASVSMVDYVIKHQKEVTQQLSRIEPNRIWDNLTHLTSYENRSASTDTGVATANWLKEQFDNMAIEYGRTDVKTYFVKTGWRYKQPSLVTVIGKDLTNPAVVIGAHMDTLSGIMPGAGDDGSGSATIMETARVLLSSKMEFKRPIYIIWYAAEERGLVGSQYVVKDFIEKSIPVMGVIQFDMTGYRVKNDPSIWIYRDYTDKRLSGFVIDLVDAYVKVPTKLSRCGYGCSDHASWNDEGFPAAFPCESSFEEHNPYIHTSADTMDLLSLEHMTNFAKLAVAFAIELASEV